MKGSIPFLESLLDEGHEHAVFLLFGMEESTHVTRATQHRSSQLYRLVRLEGHLRSAVGVAKKIASILPAQEVYVGPKFLIKAYAGVLGEPYALHCHCLKSQTLCHG
jgi:hypothetical protein